MHEISSEPAQTYQLNVLASALGRFASPDIDNEGLKQATEMVEEIVSEIIQESKPAVPHTNSTLLEEASVFDDKLINQLTNGKAAAALPVGLSKIAIETVRKHRSECSIMRRKDAAVEMLVSPQLIATSYGLADLWKNSNAVMNDEVARWSDYFTHPPIPSDLKKLVTIDETKRLMQAMWEHVIGTTNMPVVNTYLTDEADHYHVFWAPLASSLDYATPRNYDRAIQLSFDLPHNATHLAHLDALPSDSGMFRYDDSMLQRAYFEAVTVFSEYKTITEAGRNADFVDDIYNIIRPEGMTQLELSDWLVQDRGYEFKLRAARYAADVLMIEGAPFRETVHAVSELLDIPLGDAEKESRKYLAWTGLGAVYSFGYRKLLAAGITKVSDAFTDDTGAGITSWLQATKLPKNEK